MWINYSIDLWLTKAINHFWSINIINSIQITMKSVRTKYGNLVSFHGFFLKYIYIAKIYREIVVFFLLYFFLFKHFRSLELLTSRHFTIQNKVLPNFIRSNFSWKQFFTFLISYNRFIGRYWKNNVLVVSNVF